MIVAERAPADTLAASSRTPPSSAEASLSRCRSGLGLGFGLGLGLGLELGLGAGPGPAASLTRWRLAGGGRAALGLEAPASSPSAPSRWSSSRAHAAASWRTASCSSCRACAWSCRGGVHSVESSSVSSCMLSETRGIGSTARTSEAEGGRPVVPCCSSLVMSGKGSWSKSLVPPHHVHRAASRSPTLASAHQRRRTARACDSTQGGHV